MNLSSPSTRGPNSQGRPDLHPNPLVTMRKSMRLSQEQTAKRTGVTRQLVIRAEQGVYPNPPPRLAEFLLTSVDPAAVGFELDETIVYHLYHNFQKHVRRHSFGLLLPTFDFSSVPFEVHPWVEWRVRSGIKARIGPAKFYCVHPALLHKYEVQPHLVQSTPGDLQGALRQAGYSSEILANLERAYHTYKEQMRGKFFDMQELGKQQPYA